MKVTTAKKVTDCVGPRAGVRPADSNTSSVPNTPFGGFTPSGASR